MDTYDRVFYILLAFTIGGFLMAAIGILGEVLGWWNDTGTIVITGGTVIGGLAAMVTLLFGATKGSVARVEHTVVGNHGLLVGIDGKLGAMDGKLDQLDRLEKLDELDVIQATLDRQTGVLGRQLAVLERIDGKL